MRKQRTFNTLSVKKKDEVFIVDEELFKAKVTDVVRDISLSKQIVSDIEFGVGNRPSLPSCFDDDDFWKSGKVDHMVDIRRSPWDDLADACNPVNVIPKDVEPVEVSSAETPDNVD